MTHHDMFSRYSRASLSLDSVGSQTDEESSNPSPASANAVDSPVNGFPPSGSVLHDSVKDVKLEDDMRLSPGLQSGSKPGIKVGREKRKRSRVTSEQLVHLERAFQTERSPTAQDRRALSNYLGMHERQTQIWFQNRRAKAKIQDSKPDAQVNDSEPPSKSVPGPSSPIDDDIKMVHEDEPVTIIPCSDLTIGTWRRISSSANTHDLVAYVCDAKRCLNWFIHSNGYGFKMEIPFNTIVDAEYKIIGDRTGMASFALSHPPIFYLENLSSPLADKPPVRTWKRCSDWTEGHQASQVLRHTVIGSNTHLANVLRTLHSSPGASNVGAGYRSDRVMTSPMELPPPPLASLNREESSYSDVEMKGCPRSAEMHKRSLYNPPDDRYPADRYVPDRSDLRPPPHSAPADTPLSRNGLMRPQAHFDTAMYNEYTSTIQQRSDTSGYSAISAGLAIYSRPSVIQQPSYFQDFPPPRMMQPFQADVSRGSQPTAFPTPPPPLMASKYDSDFNRDRQPTHPHHISPQPMHSMGGLMYEAENNMRSR